MSRDTKLEENDKALLYNGECQYCRGFVAKAENKIKHHDDVKFIPFQDLVSIILGGITFKFSQRKPSQTGASPIAPGTWSSAMRKETRPTLGLPQLCSSTTIRNSPTG